MVGERAHVVVFSPVHAYSVGEVMRSTCTINPSQTTEILPSKRTSTTFFSVYIVSPQQDREAARRSTPSKIVIASTRGIVRRSRHVFMPEQKAPMLRPHLALSCLSRIWERGSAAPERDPAVARQFLGERTGGPARRALAAWRRADCVDQSRTYCTVGGEARGRGLHHPGDFGKVPNLIGPRPWRPLFRMQQAHAGNGRVTASAQKP